MSDSVADTQAEEAFHAQRHSMRLDSVDVRLEEDMHGSQKPRCLDGGQRKVAAFVDGWLAVDHVLVEHEDAAYDVEAGGDSIGVVLEAPSAGYEDMKVVVGPVLTLTAPLGESVRVWEVRMDQSEETYNVQKEVAEVEIDEVGRMDQGHTGWVEAFDSKRAEEVEEEAVEDDEAGPEDFEASGVTRQLGRANATWALLMSVDWVLS